MSPRVEPHAPARGTADTVVAASSDAPQVDPVVASFDVADPAHRYAARSLLGAGGMGEVHLCRDRWIGRDVAMKVVRAEHAEQASRRQRFEREARVQAQLEHPSVVPVYDLGEGTDGAAFFTMKRVRGQTLDEIVQALRRGDEAVTHTYSRRRLLTAFSSVCLAVAFAHARGVVHRDLKPANVMLGEFGEVAVRQFSMVLGVLSVVAPLCLEGIGVLAPSYTFNASGMLIVPDLVELRAAPTLVFLALTNVAAVVLSANLVGRRTLALAKAEKRLFAHAWQLRQFVPDGARDVATAPRRTSPSSSRGPTPGRGR